VKVESRKLKLICVFCFVLSAFLRASCRPWSFAEVFGKTNLLAAVTPAARYVCSRHLLPVALAPGARRFALRRNNSIQTQMNTDAECSELHFAIMRMASLNSDHAQGDPN